MKLINADEAFRVLSDYYHHRTETQTDALREALELVPEAVVRCGDCRNKPPEGYCDFYLDGMQDNDFCSYGERRTDDA